MVGKLTLVILVHLLSHVVNDRCEGTGFKGLIEATLFTNQVVKDRCEATAQEFKGLIEATHFTNQVLLLLQLGYTATLVSFCFSKGI